MVGIVFLFSLSFLTHPQTFTGPESFSHAAVSKRLCVVSVCQHVRSILHSFNFAEFIIVVPIVSITITKIIPTSDAPHRPKGDPIDILLSPHSVPGRMNIGQLLETAAGKIAEKTGKPYIVNNFEKPTQEQAAKIYD